MGSPHSPPYSLPRFLPCLNLELLLTLTWGWRGCNALFPVDMRPWEVFGDLEAMDSVRNTLDIPRAEEFSYIVIIASC